MTTAARREFIVTPKLDVRPPWPRTTIGGPCRSLETVRGACQPAGPALEQAYADLVCLHPRTCCCPPLRGSASAQDLRDGLSRRAETPAPRESAHRAASTCRGRTRRSACAS